MPEATAVVQLFQELPLVKLVIAGGIFQAMQSLAIGLTYIQTVMCIQDAARVFERGVDFFESGFSRIVI